MAMTSLQQWLDDTGTTDTALAAKVGASVASISRIKRGLQTPSLQLAVAISRETGGLVPVGNLLPADEENAA
jgi:DNA-binding XRE family transcriptional regulator